MKKMKDFRDMKKWLFAISLSIPFVLAGCSDSDDNGGDGGYASPYWPLATGNSNMPSSGTLVAQYSDSPIDAGIGKLVDGDANTSYQTPHGSFDITWNGNSNVAVKSYSLTSAADAEEQDPRDWRLSGSKDATDWVTLDEQTGQVFTARKEVKTFEVDNNVEYRYYKLSILNNNGSSSTQIAEWTLSAATFEGNIDDLMQFASGDTYTSLTPMGTQHLNDLTATADQLAWLKDATKQPDAFAGLSWQTFSVGTLYPFGDPLPADVNQHLIGDCCACAVMASMAYLFPGYIKNIIQDNGNSTWTVTLYDPQGEPVEVGVDNYFVADGSKVGASSGKSDQVTWSTVLEKALIKWYQVYRGTSDIGGIGTEYVSAIFTGNGSSFAFGANVLSAPELQRAALVSLQQRKIVVGGFSQGDVPADGNKTTTTAHAYTFMLPKSDAYLFTMRNPWGMLPLSGGGYSTDEKDDGLLNVSDDGKVPPLIDLRICDPGAAKGFAVAGNLEPYTPPSYTPLPMRVASHLLQSGM